MLTFNILPVCLEISALVKPGKRKPLHFWLRSTLTCHLGFISTGVSTPLTVVCPNDWLTDSLILTKMAVVRRCRFPVPSSLRARKTEHKSETKGTGGEEVKVTSGGRRAEGWSRRCQWSRQTVRRWQWQCRQGQGQGRTPPVTRPSVDHVEVTWEVVVLWQVTVRPPAEASVQRRPPPWTETLTVLTSLYRCRRRPLGPRSSRRHLRPHRQDCWVMLSPSDHPASVAVASVVAAARKLLSLQLQILTTTEA